MKKQTHSTIYGAIAAFQRECPAIKKESRNDFGNYNFVDMTQIVKTIKPLLEKHGIGFTQLIQERTVITVVFLSEADEKTLKYDIHHIQSTTDIPDNITLKGMNSFQVLGSGISYVKKYALSSILGITTDEDNDAAGQEEKPVKKPKLTETRFKNALKSVQEEDITVQEIKDKFELTEAQIKTLDEL